MKLDNITSVGIWVGLALIVLAWIKVIPLLYGWVGLGIALPSFIVEAIKKNCPLPELMIVQRDDLRIDRKKAITSCSTLTAKHWRYDVYRLPYKFYRLIHARYLQFCCRITCRYAYL